MDDHTHLGGKRPHHGEGESEAMLKKTPEHGTNEEEAKELLKKMKEISEHIARVSHMVLLLYKLWLVSVSTILNKLFPFFTFFFPTD